MTAQTLGILAAIISAIILGSYFTLFKFSKLSVNQYVFVMFIASTITLLVLFFFTKEKINFEFANLPFPIISGILFAFALFLVFFSIKTIGINSAAAIYVGLQLVVAVSIGIAFFSELTFLPFTQKAETIIGLFLVLSGIILVSVAKL